MAVGLAGIAPMGGGAIVVIGGLAYTAWSEWFNVYRAGNWGYTASMPMIFGIGLAPLLQWLILPPMMVFVYRSRLIGLRRTGCVTSELDVRRQS